MNVNQQIMIKKTRKNCVKTIVHHQQLNLFDRCLASRRIKAAKDTQTEGAFTYEALEVRPLQNVFGVGIADC